MTKLVGIGLGRDVQIISIVTMTKLVGIGLGRDVPNPRIIVTIYVGRDAPPNRLIIKGKVIRIYVTIAYL